MTRVDTAATYQRGATGRSEQLLGQGQIHAKGIKVGTKILIADPTGKGSLKPVTIEQSLGGSAARLQAPIEVLHCHLFDADTPLPETVATLRKHRGEGRFKELGVSNFSPEQLDPLLGACKGGDR